MKKIASIMLLTAFFAASLAAYNPPVGGEDFCLLASPGNLSGANSVTGGALFDAGAESLIVNPALTANEQRVNLNVGYTFMYSGNQLNSSKIGSAFQTGILIPFKLYIFSGYVNGTFSPFAEMNLENSLNAKAGLSKEINDKLYVGLGVSGGYAWKFNGDNDWSLCADVGAIYRFGTLGFIRDFRIAASALDLGKTYKVNRLGNDITAASTAYPTFVTLKAGIAGTLVENDMIKLGLSIDATTPCFQNFILDANAQLAFKDTFFISIGEKFNLMETIKGHSSFIPSVAFLFKFSFDVKNNQYLENNGWSQSEMKVSAGYKNLYKTVHAISGGADIDLGMADNEPPNIKLWDNE